MPVAKLTDITVRTLPHGIYYDEKMPAFGLRVGSHRRTWLVVKGKKRTQTTLGHYPAISLQDARRKAMAAFAAPDVQRGTITFPEAKAAFLAQDRWRAGSKRVLESNLRKFPWKGQLAKITHEQMIEALDAIESRSARAHALKDIRTFFNWCVPRHLPSSPAAGIKMDRQPSRDRVLTDAELKAVWIAAEQMGQFGVIVKLLILTGQRRSEIGSLQRLWISETSIILPADATKNGREHSFPLGSCATSTLSTALCSASDAARTLLFPARGRPDVSFSGWSTSHSQLLKASATSGWTLHDLRRTVATNLAALGIRQEVTEKILNHVSGQISGVAAIYNRHSYFEEMREALAKWEARLLAIVN